ncbi:MAG: V-type ATP synthase subunit F [Nitrososphaerota archaeon]
MRVVAVGSRSFIMGFRLAGAGGIEVTDAKEVLSTVNKLMSDPEVGLIILSEELTYEIRNEINEIRSKKSMPLIYVLPSPSTSTKGMDYRTLLRQVLGI